MGLALGVRLALNVDGCVIEDDGDLVDVGLDDELGDVLAELEPVVEGVGVVVTEELALDEGEAFRLRELVGVGLTEEDSDRLAEALGDLVVV